MTYKKLFFSAILLVTLCIQASAQLDTVGLIAHWPFNGNLKDSTGRGHDAATTDVRTQQPTMANFQPSIKGGLAVDFTPYLLMSGNYVPDLNLQRFTICAVVRPTISGGLFLSRDGLLSTGSDIVNYGMGFSYIGSSLAPYGVSNLGPYYNQNFSYNPKIATGKWHFLAVSYDGNTYKCYINGLLYRSMSGSGVALDTTNFKIDIGGYYDSWFIGNKQKAFIGLMDDLRLYNRVLSDSEIVRYPFNFLDTTVVPQLARQDSVLCPGNNSLQVKYITSKNFRAGNTFTVQMSDANGEFTSPVNIGNVASSVSGNINCNIPSNTPPGFYHFRIIATAPADTSVTFYVNVHPQRTTTYHLKAQSLDTRINAWGNFAGNVCKGDSVRILAFSQGSVGYYPSFAWMRNGNLIPGANANQYHTKAINTGDSFACIITNDHQCWNGLKDTTGYYKLNVDTPVIPQLTVAISPSDSICMNDTVRLIANTMQAFNNSSYNWNVRNGQTATWLGTNDTTYSWSLKNNDTIICTFTTNDFCTISPVSKTIVMYIDTAISSPKATVKAYPGSKVIPGTIITFVATTTDAGSSPTYQWLLNGIPIPGATKDSFATNALTTGDKVSILVRSSNPCAKVDSAVSNTLTVTLFAGVDEIESTQLFIIHPNPNNGAFTITTSRPYNDEISISIISLTGQVVFKTDFNAGISTEVKLPDNISPGVYLVRLTGAGKSQTARLIIEK